MRNFGDISGIDVKLPNQGGVTADGLLNNVLLWLVTIAGLAAVAVIVYGGVKYNTAQGQPDKVKQASQIIAFGVVGLVVVILAGAITAFATGIIGSAATGGSDSGYVITEVIK